jgi:hypothetical protein
VIVGHLLQFGYRTQKKSFTVFAPNGTDTLFRITVLKPSNGLINDALVFSLRSNQTVFSIAKIS